MCWFVIGPGTRVDLTKAGRRGRWPLRGWLRLEATLCAVSVLLAVHPAQGAARGGVGLHGLPLTPIDIGNPALPGATVTVPGGLDVTGGGLTIGGTNDQFHFAWQQRNGDFDVQVRVAGLSVPDPFARAGLMVRETLLPNARFGAVFSSSPLLDCFFEWRASVGTKALVGTAPTGFAANYPFTWLRLRRQGPTITGYASLEAQAWTTLGTTTLSGLPTTVYFGVAVSGDTATAAATARFRDLESTVSTAIGAPLRTKEPLGPSSRATGLVLSEIMYRPAARADGRNLEFVELANARAVPEDLTGWGLSGDIEYRFPNGYRLLAGAYVVIAAAPDDIKAVYGITNVLGPYTGALPGSSGTVRLLNNSQALRLEVNYGSESPWPAAADGAGHSLVLARASLGEADPAAWAASEFIGGSPGAMDPTATDPAGFVMINEFLAHTDLPEVDYVELYNHSNVAVDVGGCYLTDTPATIRFRLPDGTQIPARGFLVVTETELGFRLNAAGETLFFVNAAATRVLDAIRFDGQENGVASGRFPDSAPTVRRLARSTPGAANAPARPESVVITELMYAPLSGDADDQYLELYNRTASPVNLGGWQLTRGIDFAFPADTVLAPGGFLVVAKNAVRLRANYPHLNPQNTLGDFAGKLSDNGDTVVLTKPHWILSTNEHGQIGSNAMAIAVGAVRYGVGGRWGQWSNGGGSSLELIDPNADPLRAANWADSIETNKAPWTTVAVTNKLEFGNTGFSPNRLRIGLQGMGECLVDDIEVFRSGTATNLVTNGSFESGPSGWSLLGNHSLSTVDVAGGASGPGCLHVRAQAAGDTGVNSVRTVVKSGLTANNIGVIRAKVRWLAGWPEVLFRLQGNWLELPARMAVPRNLGTPGLPNSRLVANAGPAIFDVTHWPLLPRANEPVVVTCRMSDPDGIGNARVRYRIDPATALADVTLRDDGAGGDWVAGDGMYAATIPGQANASVVAFQIVAADASPGAANATFPALAPAQECLVRWGDTVPFGTFSHYHLWNTRATDTARSRSVALDNTWRDGTLVYGNIRVIYNAGFRDKGSPWHQGFGDFTVTVPEDDRLLGATQRAFASTGNAGPEETGIRSQLSAWLAQQLGIPYLHAHYIRFYRNGASFRSLCEDLEVPDRAYTRQWFPEGERGDFYKLAMRFDFQDDNVTFSNPVHCTLERFRNADNSYNLARYRWNWDRRPDGGTANNYTNLFDLLNAANDTSASYATRLQTLADMEEWMRVFAFHRISGNWDHWTYNVGQNMYALKQPGQPWKLIPWDIDFTFGLGDGSSSPLGAGSLGGNCQDPVAVRLYDTPAFRRMLWRAHQDAAAGPLLATNYTPQVVTRRTALLKNGITDVVDPRGVTNYLEQRRTYILNQLKVADPKLFAITTSSGNDYASATPTTALQGTAPFAVATIEVNGVAYPITWQPATTFRIEVPLTQATNTLVLVGKDRLGRPVAGATDSIKVTYTGAIPQVQDYVVLNEVHYNPIEPDASFVELFNRSTSVPFDLSGLQLGGVGYVFPNNAVIGPGGYLVLVKDRAGFARAYGATIPVFDEFPGSLDNGGEHLALVKPLSPAGESLIVSDLRYDNRLPWPTDAAGLGPSLQLIDPAQGSYRVGNWGATQTNDVNRVTPGRTNATARGLAPFPPLWINEIQPRNTGAVRTGGGLAAPWIELYNAGNTALDLSPYLLTDSYTNLARWAFPAGTTIGPRQFLLVWADGQNAGAPPNELHANFQLSPTNGSIALVRFQGSPPAPAVVDYVDYPEMPAGRSYGCFPDGEPRRRQWFEQVTAGATNNPTWTPVTVTVNELLAANTRTLVDPANGRYEDWFELYNAGPSAVDLSGYTLTDRLADPGQFTIPSGTTIGPRGFTLVWADKTPEAITADGSLHVNFKLAKEGGELGLFAPSGALVDSFTFPAQTNDVSAGRFPDGADLPLLTFEQPTPAAANSLAGGNRPPVFAPLSGQTAVEAQPLAFAVSAVDPDEGQHVTYSLGPDAPAGARIDPATGEFVWTPGEADAPAIRTFSLRATDDGSPPRISALRVTVTIAEVNAPPILDPVPDQVAAFGRPLAVLIAARDPDLPAGTLTYQLDEGAPEGAEIDAASAVLTWTPLAWQVPGLYTLTVRVTDDGEPALTVSQQIRVTLEDVPRPPVFRDIQPQTITEFAVLNLTVQADDPNEPAAPLTYSLDIAPEGAAIEPTTGQLTWTPTEAQGPTNAVFVVRATKSTPPGLSGTATFGVKVEELNRAPVLEAIASQVARFGETLVIANGATDADLPANELKFSLGPGAPVGMAIDPDTGTLSWTPGADQVPSTNQVTVRVTDDGLPPLSDSQRFNVWAKRGSPWRYATARGTASSSSLYVYLTTPGEVYLDDLMLVAGDQPGVGPNLIANGDFESALAGSWTISPNHAGSSVDSQVKHAGNRSLHVVAASGGTTRASSIYQEITPALINSAPYTLSFWYLPGKTNTSLTIRLSGRGLESVTPIAAFTNAPPVLNPIGDQLVLAGNTLALFLTATDRDLPNQDFLFGLEPPVPAGATLDSVNGLFLWRPDITQAPSTNRITARVTDNGAPPLSHGQTFTVIVQRPPLTVLDPGVTAEGNAAFSWYAEPGRTYRVESTTDPVHPAWTPLADLTATELTLRFTDLGPSLGEPRYYRVLQLP